MSKGDNGKTAHEPLNGGLDEIAPANVPDPRGILVDLLNRIVDGLGQAFLSIQERLHRADWPAGLPGGGDGRKQATVAPLRNLYNQSPPLLSGE